MALENYEELTVFDGAIGTEVQKRSPTSEDSLTDVLNLTQPEVIKSIHRDYLAAGAQVLTTNTFSSNEIRLSRSGYGEKTKELNEKGARLARKAVEDISGGTREISIAGSIGPTGETLVPLGDWTFDQFYETFRSQAKALNQGGVDWIIIETMESLREASAALVACKEIGLPVISSLSYGDRGRTSYGVMPASGAVTLDYTGADVLAINCGTGPGPYPDIIKTYSQSTSKPLLAEANAGDPRLEGGEAVYDLTPEQYLGEIRPGLPYLSGVGSCCGSNPDFTKALAEVAPEYGGRTKSTTPTEDELITNNSTVIPVSEETEFEEIAIGKDDLTDFKNKIISGKVNMLNFSEISRQPAELEELLARQFLQLRSSNPLGIVTDDSKLLKTFLTASPGISPVRATGNEDSVRSIAEKYGGLII
ncbi:MAG: homocysteine S-methyltransferase family protein [Candidatus Bipolaricaulota bacterium]|nr:homocysteine S-methyltransferase family protein [Candidatus Bipolaricaulota bacterium]